MHASFIDRERSIQDPADGKGLNQSCSPNGFCTVMYFMHNAASDIDSTLVARNNTIGCSNLVKNYTTLEVVVILNATCRY